MTSCARCRFEFDGEPTASNRPRICEDRFACDMRTELNRWASDCVERLAALLSGGAKAIQSHEWKAAQDFIDTARRGGYDKPNSPLFPLERQAEMLGRLLDALPRRTPG